LALCQRYFYQWSAANSGFSQLWEAVMAFNATQAYILLKPAMTMRVPPQHLVQQEVLEATPQVGGRISSGSHKFSYVLGLTRNMITLEVTVGSGWVAGNAALMNAGASTACKIRF
jgi:hypothetical protein